MKKYYSKFNHLLLNEDRYECIKYAKSLLDEKLLSVTELYEKILGPVMCDVGNKVEAEEVRIWQEHVYASIVRSVVENCYPYVIEEVNENKTKANKKVLVICPKDEFHEIGPRMVADFFTILGYKTTYVGSNTPKEDVILAIKNVKPDIVAISVSNYYNIFAAKNTIELIKSLIDYDVKIIVGGGAFEHDKDAYKQIEAHYQAKTFDDIKRIGREI